jgi:hypothetical protein
VTKRPPSATRVHLSYSADEIDKFSERIKGIDPELR